jgi:exosortase
VTARRRTQAVVAVLCVALVAVLFAPTLSWLGRSWLVHPYYSHGPLMPLVAAALVWRARGAFAGARPDDRGLAVLAAGVTVHLAAMRWAAFPWSALALLLVAAGFALLVGGRRALEAMLLPLTVLALAIPIPIVEHLAPPLAAGVARAAAAAAGCLGVPVARAGAQLAVGDGAFVVGAPCSGLRSLVALGSLAVVLAGVVDTSRRRRIALVAAALPLALGANWLRLTSLLYVADVLGTDAGLRIFHGLAGPALFALAIAGLLGTGRALGCEVRLAR